MLQAGLLAIVCKLATIKFCLATHYLIYGIVKALQTKSPSCIEYIASVGVGGIPVCSSIAVLN